MRQIGYSLGQNGKLNSGTGYNNNSTSNYSVVPGPGNVYHVGSNYNYMLLASPSRGGSADAIIGVDWVDKRLSYFYHSNYFLGRPLVMLK